MMKGRNISYDKNWETVEANVKRINIGSKKDSVIVLLGSPDEKYHNENSVTWSYQEYGVIAPHWVYDIEIRQDTVYQIDSYEW